MSAPLYPSSMEAREEKSKKASEKVKEKKKQDKEAEKPEEKPEEKIAAETLEVSADQPATDNEVVEKKKKKSKP